MSNTSVFTKEEKERIRKFITPDLRPSYLLFKDKNDNPGKYVQQEQESSHKIKPRSSMSYYLQQFKDSFVQE